jgi:hypothetical protein
MTLPNDPNGISYEAWIESKAGASPPASSRCSGLHAHEAHWFGKRWCSGRDWPQPQPPPYPADDEDKATP